MANIIIGTLFVIGFCILFPLLILYTIFEIILLITFGFRKKSFKLRIKIYIGLSIIFIILYLIFTPGGSCGRIFGVIEPLEDFFSSPPILMEDGLVQ